MIGSSSFGTAFVAGRKRVPKPAAGMRAVRTCTAGMLGGDPPDNIWHSTTSTANPPPRLSMPTYVYKFIETGETIDVQQAFTDDALTEVAHPSTGTLMRVKKVFTPVGVTFKGGGFYKTDSRGKSSKAGANGSPSHGPGGAPRAAALSPL